MLCVVQSPQREHERARRRVVEPLHVVDRDEEAPSSREELQARPESRSRGCGIQLFAHLLCSNERDFERTPPWSGQRRSTSSSLQQISETDVRETELGLGRS